jgi:hypothetical protein
MGKACQGKRAVKLIWMLVFRFPSSGETGRAIGTRVMDAMEADHVVAAMEEARCEQVPECVTGGALSESVRMAQEFWIDM